MFAVSPDGVYRNNAVSERLRADHPASLRDWALMFGSRWHVDVWNHLDHSVRTGESAAVEALGRPFFDHLTEVDTAAGELFDRAMAAASRLQTELIPSKYDFSTCRRVCDVGGGTGTLLAGVLAANPGVQGVLYDLPPVVRAPCPC